MQKPQLQYLQNYDEPHADQHVAFQFAGVNELDDDDELMLNVLRCHESY